MRTRLSQAIVFIALAFVVPGVSGQQAKPQLIPHAQDKPPNDPRDPQTAAKMMTVPEGFSVEVVAAEPDIVNPVAMAIDDRGRFWITESLEYPRREPGLGRDRVKVLEDTDGDGKADRFTVFLSGLNIPSGIAVGHGGVWIANAPDILFVQDTDGDGKADKQEVIVTGFGRTDTHELPNSLTWGPDGWLYGLNGVFNHSHVKYSPTNPNYDESHPGWPLTCALFRIHPRTREFQVFCEGTSNPWGVAYNDEGEAFISACVIDHLWHLSETGYYHRQGGPYPPFTWKIESIVKHKHQKAAYCGIHFFDSDAYPEKYRGKLYMGNIHGGCINSDRIEASGATYRGLAEPDFLTANDSWFMPVVQKTGPDGSLYVLDWYDRYHCYQDANRDPAGIDRLKGRLYRVRYKDTPRAPKDFDLAKESDDALIARLGANNDFIRSSARRILQERNTAEIANKLLQRIEAERAKPSASRVAHRQFMTLTGMSAQPTEQLRKWNANEPDSTIRAWQLRYLGDHPTGDAAEMRLLKERSVQTNDLREQFQIVVAAAKLERSIKDPSANAPSELLDIFLTAISQSSDDPILSRIVWQNMHPYLESSAFVHHLVERLNDPALRSNGPLTAMMPRIIDRLLGRKEFDPKPVAQLVAVLTKEQPETAAIGLGRLSTKVQNGELSAEHLESLKHALEQQLSLVLAGPAESPLYLSAAFLSTSWNDPKGVEVVRQVFSTDAVPPEQRLLALNSLVTAKDAGLVEAVAVALDSPGATAGFKSQVLAALSKLDDPRVASVVLGRYEKLDGELQPRAIELLTQRSQWAIPLLKAIGDKQVAATAINLNQARRLKDLKDEELSKLLATHWGQVREGRDPNREQFIAQMRQTIRSTPGDPFAGEKAFKKVCAQCHKIYGEGAEVGPDITLNGRNNFEQLLSNVLDPSLVIGAGYRSYTVITQGGRVLNGLLAEESDQRVVLKIQGGKQEVIPRSDIDEFKVNEISLMPEQLEKQLTPQEILDLFAFLTLDKHPSDKTARQLAGSAEVVPKQTTNPAEFGGLVNQVLPGFTTVASGELGVAILKDHFGRPGVLRTHPVSKEKPCVLTAKVMVPKGKKTALRIDASHDPQGDWLLVARANGQQIFKGDVSPKTCSKGWGTFKIDLSQFAGQEVALELQNVASGWSYEFGYWGDVQVISE